MDVPRSPDAAQSPHDAQTRDDAQTGDDARADAAHAKDHGHADAGQVSIPALLRAARGSYALVIGAHLAAGGFDDLPRNGPFVLGGMANWGGSASDMIRALGVSKQAASQLIDTLVLRGYLTREVNPSDRRRMTIDLTDRGRAAAAAVAAAVGEVDARLTEMISPAQMTGLRAGLTALAAIKDEAEDA